MKKILGAIWTILSVPVMYVVAFALQFWWLYLIFLACGAYQTAAKEWGWGAGIVSILMAFVLPVASFVLWCAAFDKDPNEVRKAGPYSRKASGRNGDVRESYLKLLAAMMAKMAKADGHVDVSEIQAAEHAFERLGFTDEQRRVCIDSFRNALNESFNVEYYASKMNALSFSYEMRIVAYEILWDIAAADGVLAAAEKAMLETLEHCLKLAPGTFARYFRQRVHAESGNGYGREHYEGGSSRRDDLTDEYGELGCSPDSSDEELKSAYRNLAKKLHPDVLRAQGMPESLMGRANARMARINAAWDKIKRARKIGG